MELLLTIAIWAGLVWGVYKWAESKGRNAVFWAAVAVLLSPLIAAVILIFVSDTLEKQAEKAKKLKELMDQ